MKSLCILPLVLLLSSCAIVQRHAVENCLDTTNTIHETNMCLQTVDGYRVAKAYAAVLDEQVHAGKITEAEAKYDITNKVNDLINAARPKGGNGGGYNNRSHTCTYGSNVINCD